MDLDCREQIISEDYADLLVSYVSSASIEESGYCYSIITNNIAVVYVPLEDLPSDYLHVFDYSVNPSCRFSNLVSNFRSLYRC